MAGARAALAGIGGSFDMPAGGQEITAVPLGPTGLVVPRGAPVKVVIGGAITRQPTPGLLFFCSTPEWNWACTSFWADLVSADPIPPAGIFGFYARAFASWDGATPGTMDGDNDLTLAGPSGGEVYAGRAGWQCFYELNVKNPDGTLKYPYDFGPCHTFGGGYNVSVQPNDGGGALIVTASPSQLPAGGGSVTFMARSADASDLSDIVWNYVPDAGASAAAAPRTTEPMSPDRMAVARAALERGDVLVPRVGGRLARGRPEGGGIFFVREAPTETLERRAAARAPVAAGAITRVNEIAAGASSCDGQAACTQQVIASGTMLVQATVHGQPLSAAAKVDVGTGGGGPPPKPPAVRIHKASSDMIAPSGLGMDFVRLEIAVVDSNGAVLPSRVVTLTVAATEGTAGHEHIGGKPAGSFDGAATVTLNTGSDGVVYTVYVAPPPAGPVKVQGASDGADPASVTVEVGLGGLTELLEGGSVAYAGNPGSHHSRHWGTPAMVSSIKALGDSLQIRAGEFNALPDSLKAGSRFPSVLGVNDMSLALGGLFDFRGTWARPHDEHRKGTNADIDVRGGDQDDDYADAVTAVWVTAFHLRAGDERTDKNHVHLRM